jgi:DNA-binding HxlR family transcriptional regulator
MKKDNLNALCPVEVAVNLIGNKWKVLILRNLLYDGTQRYGELQRGINGISQKMLTQQLREMERDGLIVRKEYPQVPPRVEYSLSERGKSLKLVIDALHDWGTNYMKDKNGPSKGS